jgi:hypothetical protein
MNQPKKRKKTTQNNKIREENGYIKTNVNEIHKVIGEYFENLYSNKLEDLEEMNKFLDAFDQLKLNQEDISNVNRSTASHEIETAIIKKKKNSK